MYSNDCSCRGWHSRRRTRPDNLYHLLVNLSDCQNGQQHTPLMSHTISHGHIEKLQIGELNCQKNARLCFFFAGFRQIMVYSKGDIKNLAVVSILFAGVLYLAVGPLNAFSNPFFPFQNCRCSSTNLTSMSLSSPKDELLIALERASMENKTVILAFVNKAYVERKNLEKTMLDLFLDGFWLGEGTRGLMDHLLLVAMDQVAYDRCKFLKLNCYKLMTEGLDFREEKFYMSEDFIKMMWRRTLFLSDVLKRGYNFIFTDTDVMWLRNPLLKLIQDEADDLQISCDYFNGNPHSEANKVINTGFYYVRSNSKTIALFELWHAMKKNFPRWKEQDVLFNIMHRGVFRELGLKVKFLDTLYFSGFCQNSRDFNAVTTVHANCCRGINSKVADLMNVLRDWRKFIDSNNHTLSFQWSKHQACINSW
ncbi:hypothetical protein NE237_024713 [Protea cynaroides]|uniref:Nucleotide-diphospho-sugar transferase domain-containing protein n=1 Tax=Protea cynaroides TaxID=273540 RepID=A0A9Q0JZV8_9MAGN|nr:hypothetical protein NE237_024713 [Protea cynaroides]